MNLPPDLEPSPAPSGRPDPIDGLGTPTGSGPPPPPDPTLPSIDPVRIPPDLETRIRRDAQRGRRLVLLTWLIAIANLPLGLVAIRQAVLLADVDRRLVSTPDIRQAAATFEFARVALPIALLLLLALAIPWLLGAVSDLSTLRELGVVDGPSPGHGFRRLALLWRAAGAGPDRAGWIDVRVGDGQSAMRSMAAAVGVAGVVGLAALVGVSQASDADGSRIWHLAAGVDGLIWLASIIVLGIAIDTVSWREAAAARALGVYIPSIDGPGRTLVRLAPPVLIFLAGASAAVGLPHPLVAICPEESRLTCQGMLVAADRDGSSDSTFTIVWAVHHATTAPKGTLAIAVGGPGESGLSESSGILASLDPRLVAAYDILFWDQRGVGASEGADCPEAGAEYAGSKGGAAVIQAFVDACLSEAGVAPADVDRYASVQAAEDLEAIRDRLGIGRFALYGESYGTELAQVYAARHPDRLTALVLDGAIDVTRSANDFWADAAHGFDRVLNDTFLACQDEAGCRAHLADPAAAYDEAFGLFEPQRTVAYADTDGTVRDHQVDAAEVEIAIDTLLYEPAGRMLVARALAASSHGDEVPLARLVAVLGSGTGPGISSFAYHAIMCADYRVSPTSDPHDLDATMARGKELGIDSLRTRDVYASQLPCLFWPYQPATGDRPAPLTTTPFPVVVLGALDDPITPIDQARAIVGRLADGYLVVSQGGPHVTFGRGVRCVDDPVVALLVDNARPAVREIDCPGAVAPTFLPLSPARGSAIAGPVAAVVMAEDEVFADPSYVLWDRSRDLHVGCRTGGKFIVTANGWTDQVSFSDCAFAEGWSMNGEGTYDIKSGALHWTLTTPRGALSDDGIVGTHHVTGTWDGDAVDLTG